MTLTKSHWRHSTSRAYDQLTRSLARFHPIPTSLSTSLLIPQLSYQQLISQLPNSNGQFINKPRSNLHTIRPCYSTQRSLHHLHPRLLSPQRYPGRESFLRRVLRSGLAPQHLRHPPPIYISQKPELSPLRLSARH